MSIESRRETMQALLAEREEIHEQMHQLDAVIKALRNICRHKNPDGTSALKFKNSDSHRHYFECQVCFEQTEE